VLFTSPKPLVLTWVQVPAKRELEKVKTEPMPKGQKYAPGTRVRITGGDWYKGLTATVEYTYAQAYWGDDVKSYSLNVDGRGSSAWHHEENLTALAEQPNVGAEARVPKPTNNERL